jgi:UDP:flavonoid glycosyltransferase YjiC (YdhE family)
MARILIGTVPILGHINPFLPLVRELAARGHELRWYTGAKYRGVVAAAGATYAPMVEARDYDDANTDAAFPGRDQLAGAEQLKFDMKHIFINNGVAQLHDLQTLTRSFQADLLLADSAFVGAGLLHELTGLPLGVLNVLPLGLSSRDTAPFGLGLGPDRSPFGHLRNRALQWSAETLLFGDVQRAWQAARATVGLGRGPWLLDWARSSSLYVQPSVPGFEYPRSDLPAHVHFIGALPVGRPAGWEAPTWWGELDGGRPVVHISQGTIANQAPTLIAPALAGLSDEDVLVVVSTGGRPVEQLLHGSVPDNARISTFLSYPDLLPRVAAMVTNGGYGGAQLALSYGVPLVVAGTTEDKPEVAARVAWSGAGLNLRTATPTPMQVRDAVRALLSDGRYRARAQALQTEYASYEPVALGVQLIERLAATGRPVLRDATPGTTLLTDLSAST